MDRYTFTTTVTLTNGIPIESVSKMLRYKNIRMTQHYAKVVDRKVSDDMAMQKKNYQVRFLQKVHKKTFNKFISIVNYLQCFF